MSFKALPLVFVLACASRPQAQAPAPLVAADVDQRVMRVVDQGRAVARGGVLPEGFSRKLRDPVEGEAAAWALGRTPDGVRALQECVERGCPAAAAAARALSGPGATKANAPPVATLVAALQGPAPLATEAATSLGVLARSGHEREVSDPARSALAAALGREEPAVRAAAAYALGRVSRGPAVEAAAGSRLAVTLDSALRDADPAVRFLAARAWGRQGLAASGLAGALQDPDWRVRVEAARALAMLPDAGPVLAAAMPAAVAELSRPGVAQARFAHALVALLESAEKLGEPALAAIPAPERLAGPTRAATVAVRCAAAQARDRIRKLLADTPGCGAGLEPEWRSRMRAGALAAELSPASPALAARARAALHDPDARVRGATAGASPGLLAADLRALLADEDPVVVQEAAGALAKDTAVLLAREPALQAIQRLSAARDQPAGEPRADALAALVELVMASRPPEPPKPVLALLPVQSVVLARAIPGAPRAMPSIPPEAQKVPAASALRIRTTAGELVVALHTAEAPLATRALTSLARRNFFDGLSFHRVVPDFVVQGGDPRGDGDGGPGWSVPDEHSPLRFQRGTLGIATSGPETGSSQFFLCHSPQPHLDGRYTVAGELREGSDVLDALQPGDTILSVIAE